MSLICTPDLEAHPRVREGRAGERAERADDRGLALPPLGEQLAHLGLRSGGAVISANQPTPSSIQFPQTNQPTNQPTNQATNQPPTPPFPLRVNYASIGGRSAPDTPPSRGR